jgi:aconitate hydratase
MGRYLRSTDRSDAADKVAEYLTGDEEVYANPELYFDQVIEINLRHFGPTWLRQFHEKNHYRLRPLIGS